MIVRELFGVLDEKEIYKYKVVYDDIEAEFCEFGACVTSVILKDKKGNNRDVVLGIDRLELFPENSPAFGSVVGRYANRIKHAKFEFNGKEYQLQKNEGDTCLHSGDSYHYRKWNSECYEDREGAHIIFSLFSPDNDQGFPGNLNISVEYIVTEEKELVIHYTYDTDKDTCVNLTNHSYFNLNGHDSGNAMEHKVMIAADGVTQVDDKLLPTGKILDVAGSAFDFRKPTVIKENYDKTFVPYCTGDDFDINYVLNDYDGTLRHVAYVEGDKSGIRMDVYTDLPGLQFYTANALEEFEGKDNVFYTYNHAFCMETQYFPDSVNIRQFPSPFIQAGELKSTTTKYSFSVAPKKRRKFK